MALAGAGGSTTHTAAAGPGGGGRGAPGGMTAFEKPGSMDMTWGGQGGGAQGRGAQRGGATPTHAPRSRSPLPAHSTTRTPPPSPHLAHRPHLHNVAELLVHDPVMTQQQGRGGRESGRAWCARAARAAASPLPSRPAGQAHLSVNSPLEILSSIACCSSCGDGVGRKKERMGATKSCKGGEGGHHTHARAHPPASHPTPLLPSPLAARP